jgi:hypothetical protein
MVLLRHLGKERGIPAPDVASLRALCSRGRSLRRGSWKRRLALRFPVERYAERLLPSRTAPKTRATR